MIAPASTQVRPEHLETSLSLDVPEAEYRRLLGYPANHTPGERAIELMAAARKFAAEHARPFIYRREIAVGATKDGLQLDGRPFQSADLQRHFSEAGVDRALLVAVSAGPAIETEARRRWEDGKPDEYFFLEVYGSALVEHLVIQANALICADAEAQGLGAIPHYSPGYVGWNVAEQVPLFALIRSGCTQGWPERVDVLSSGMLRPKKSLLAVVGLAPRRAGSGFQPDQAPCPRCALPGCQYRRAPYRHAPADAAPSAPRAAAAPAYSVNVKALERWRRERVRLTVEADGSLRAAFRFDGTTCSNMGVPLAFDYEVQLAGRSPAALIRATSCRPAPGDEGYQSMCAFLANADRLLEEIAEPPPVVGRPLADVLTWRRDAAPAGCHCDAASRAHKWGLALEAIHYALTTSKPELPSSP